MTAQRRVLIFDTTLRDGEQSPGCSMNLAEKLEMAHALAELGWTSWKPAFPSPPRGLRGGAGDCQGDQGAGHLRSGTV
ncbi:MAG: hypothetical protein U0935_11465 [Pirellulales bacterium]